MNTEIYVSDQVRKVRLLHREIINQTTSEMTVKQQLETLSENLFVEFQKGNSSVSIEISNWHPKLVGENTETIMNAEFLQTDAEETVARGYGYSNWDELQSNGDHVFDMVFEHAIDTMINGNIELLKKKVKKHTNLLNDRSRYGHRATLLHYVSSNGVEIRRQKVPLNIAEIARFLIDAGADPDAKARFYQGEFTALELAATSAHPKDAGIDSDLIEILRG